MSFYQFIKALALPPASLCLALFLGLLISLRWRRAGFTIIAATAVVFYLLAAPFVANRLSRVIAVVPPLAAGDDATAQAIVILSAGASPGGPEYGGVMLDDSTVVRLRYGAHLYHRKQLPVLVSGGVIRGTPSTLADSMKQALEQDFAVPVTWVENRSVDTAENALFSAEILKEAKISTVLLVTGATHMPRAANLFAATGLKVIPAPTDFAPPVNLWPQDLIPRMGALERSQAAVYEILGAIWSDLGVRKPETGIQAETL